MSDLALTEIAYLKANSYMDKLIEEYNNPQLTQKGKREALLNCLAFSFMSGFKLSEDKASSLKSQLKEVEEIMREQLGNSE